MPEVDNTAEATTALNTASDAALANLDVAAYREIENSRAAAVRTGKPIPEAPAPSPDPLAASEAAPKTAGEKKAAPKTGEDRKAQLAAEIQVLLDERAKLQGKIPAPATGDKIADPPPAAAAAVKPAEAAAAKAKAPVEPNIDDKNADGTPRFATFAEYQIADRKFVRETIQFETQQALAADRATQAASAQNKALEDSWQGRVETAKTKHSDFADVAFSKDTPVSNAMDGFILDSEIGPEVLYRLGENGSAEGKRIFALAPYPAVRALLAIETELLAGTATGAAAGAGTATATTPAKRHTTAAPAPATDLGARNTDAGGDPILAALARGDTETYRLLSNARDAKARRGH